MKWESGLLFLRRVHAPASIWPEAHQLQKSEQVGLGVTIYSSTGV